MTASDLENGFGRFESVAVVTERLRVLALLFVGSRGVQDCFEVGFVVELARTHKHCLAVVLLVVVVLVVLVVLFEYWFAWLFATSLLIYLINQKKLRGSLSVAGSGFGS